MVFMTGDAPDQHTSFDLDLFDATLASNASWRKGRYLCSGLLALNPPDTSLGCEQEHVSLLAPVVQLPLSLIGHRILLPSLFGLGRGILSRRCSPAVSARDLPSDLEYGLDGLGVFLFSFC
jgi:hypothetical protein